MKQKYIFYCGEPGNINLTNNKLNQDYSLKIWEPCLYKIKPNKKFFIYWALYYLGFFANHNYKVFTIYHNKSKELAHYSVVLPKYFRTPFMENRDFQIGPIDTSPKHRRKGLATYTIKKILEFYKKQNPKFWYIVREENKISRECIKKIGFLEYGEGIKKKRLNTNIFSTFVIKKKYYDKAFI